MPVIYKITDLTSDGRGVARREDGRVVFIEGAVPGDSVLATFQPGGKKKPLEGRVETIIVPSPDRTEHPCHHYAQGCPASPLGSLTYKAALDWKQNHLRETILRLGKKTDGSGFGLSVENKSSPGEALSSGEDYRDALDRVIQPIVPSLLPWSYRERIELTLEKEETWLGGYRTADGVLPVKDCHLAMPSIRNSIREIEKALSCKRFQPDPSLWRRALRLLLRDNGMDSVVAVLFVATNKKFDTRPYREFFTSLTTLAGWQIRRVRNLNIRFISSDVVAEDGDVSINVPIKDSTIKVGPATFSQANREGTDTLVNLVLDTIADETHVLDLYGGYGAFGLAHALRGGSSAVADSAAEALTDGWRFARENRLDVYYLQADFSRNWPEKLDVNEFQCVILDPPRGGTSQQVLERLNNSSVEQIVYVSCHPAALVRDLTSLTQYRIGKIIPVDMFPQTPDLETIAVLNSRK